MDWLSWIAVLGLIGFFVYRFVFAPFDTNQTKLRASYDYIVVGGGSAGAVIASRLSEDADVTVCLLEAGPGELSKMEIGIPAASAQLQISPVDWAYRTVPQKHSSGALKSRVSHWPRGKVLGGSSSINYMQYVRGHAEDYNRWGVKGWDWQSVLPYFLKSEQCLIPELVSSADKAHSANGPMAVSFPKEPHPMAHVFVAGCDAAGIKKVADYNNSAGDNHGCSISQTTTRNGRREDTSSAFLRPHIGKRPNLDVLTSAHVTRILFDDEKAAAAAGEPRATGVAFKRGGISGTGAMEVVRASREIICCGGAVNSPQLLMLSGIGPAKELKKHSIQVVSDLSGVGQNLQDHLLFPVAYECNGSQSYSEADASLKNFVKYAANRTGPFTTTGLECTAFFNTGVRDDLKAPDMQIHFLAACIAPKDAANTNVDPSKVSITGPPSSFACICVGLHPRSVGSITLASNDPFVHPIIDPNYLSHADDVKAFVIGARKIQEIVKTKPFQPHTGGLIARTNQLIPEADRKECGAEDSDSEWGWRVRQSAVTCYHPVGTCKMGTDCKDGAVVDPELRVFGVRGLRVADCSIMPDVPSGNTNAPAIMVGEKAADLIKSARKAAK